MRLLLEHPTPARLAAALRRAGRDGEDAGPSAASPRPAVFVFGGLGGHCLRVGALCLASAEVLDMRVIDYPDWRSMRGRAAFDHMLKALAREAAALAPTGPLRLAGYSLGGIVAYGVALELVRMGRTVAFVGLLDAMAPIAPRDLGQGPIAFLRGRLSALARLRRENGLRTAALLYAPVTLLRLASNLARFVPAFDHDTFEFRLGIHALRGLFWQWRSDRSRLGERLAAPMVLFRVRKPVDEALYGGWPYRSDRFDTVTVEGDHFSMLQAAHIEDLVGKLERAVRAVEPHAV